jgi:glycosyltransferase involved in cell wall biosynthesis
MQDHLEASDRGLSLQDGRYRLAPFVACRQDSLEEFFGREPGVYVCNFPEPAWYQRFGLKRKRNLSVEKKRETLRRMGTGSLLLSPTQDDAAPGPTSDWQNGVVFHVGNGGLRGRAGQAVQALRMVEWLAKHRQDYAYCLVYNFSPTTYLGPLMAKALLGKPILVDYEDDYTLTRPSPWKNLIEATLRRTPDGVICINESMLPYFEGKRVIVSNCLSDLSYLSSADYGWREGMTLLYSGLLDDIRGVDLVPSIVEALRARLKSFRVWVCGDGPLRPVVESWTLPEVEYLGFLDDNEYDERLQRADACLLLQKPDHPFSRGSFPSKVDMYARYRKPVYVVELRR